MRPGDLVACTSGEPVQAEGLVALDVSTSGCEGVALIRPGLSQEQRRAIVDTVSEALPGLRALILQEEAKSGKTDTAVA